MTVTLSEMEEGQPGVIRAIEGGGGIRQRLANLGMRPGDAFRVIHAAPFRGPVLVEIRGASIAIGHGMARRVSVEVAGTPCA